MSHEQLPLFILWEKIIGDLLDRTGKFPKSVRFTFTTRIDNLALDILENIVEACYLATGKKQAMLRDLDLALARLRVLLRLCHERKYLDSKGFEYVIRGLDEAGRMVGGWRRQQTEP
jgi:hypothetical protein